MHPRYPYDRDTQMSAALRAAQVDIEMLTERVHRLTAAVVWLALVVALFVACFVTHVARA